MSKVQVQKRVTVNIDDRRTIFMVTKGRSLSDQAKVPNEAFIRRELKARMGWDKDEPAPDTIKQAAKDMAASILSLAKEAAAAAEAKKVAKVPVTA